MATGDKALVRRTLDGDREAFGDLVERYSALVRGIVYEKVRRLDEVEDLVQEVFCRAYEDLSRLHEPGRFAPWLGRIAANIALDWLRRRQIRDRSRQSGQLLTLAPRTTQPDEIFEESENSGILWEALDSLSPDYRRIVVLYHIEGCSQPEISRFLGLTVPVVRWRLRKARQKLGAD